MSRRTLMAIVVLLAAGILIALFVILGAPSVVGQPSPTLILSTPQSTPDFARALEPRAFSFPADHGPHLQFQTEWWYYTGNVEGEDGNHYGYQLTFFRRGLASGAAARPSDLATTQIYFAHFAITDVDAGEHMYVERFSRGAPALAGAASDPFSVWLESWRVDSLDPEGDAVRIRADQGDMLLDLTLRSTKPITLHGDRGLSLKGEVLGNASYYLSYTRMATQGMIALLGRQASVTGNSWYDHEWSTSALPPRAVGWDWFSLQLDDGREVMYFQIRNGGGTIDPSAAGTIVEVDGSSHSLAATDISLEAKGSWRSPQTGGVYPIRWRVSVPSAGLDLTLEPWLEDQELRVSFPYWEGAVKILDERTGEVIGQGYVELTGYAESLQGTF